MPKSRDVGTLHNNLRQNFAYVKTYIDDGYTRRSFNRPGFIEMMEDLRYSNVAIYRFNNDLVLYRTGSNYINLRTSATSNSYVQLSDFPKTEGASLSCYMPKVMEDYANVQSKPVVIITCVAVNEPTWSWAGTSSAKATFTVSGTDYCVTANATPTVTSNATAANCLEKDKITYTATVTLNGNTYTDTKKVDGAAGPHSYTYSKTSENTVTESCSKCSNHTASATLTATDATYTGSTITTGASIDYSEGWQGDKLQSSEITVTNYTNNINVGTATVTTTVEGKELTTIFKINAADANSRRRKLSAICIFKRGRVLVLY